MTTEARIWQQREGLEDWRLVKEGRVSSGPEQVVAVQRLEGELGTYEVMDDFVHGRSILRVKALKPGAKPDDCLGEGWRKRIRSAFRQSLFGAPPEATYSRHPERVVYQAGRCGFVQFKGPRGMKERVGIRQGD